MPTAAKILGDAGERQAREYLEGLGYRILALNWRSHPVELDLVCEQREKKFWGRGKSTIVFVEVKTRTNGDIDSALGAFSAAKQQHLLNAAQKWLSRNDAWDKACRFDLICINGRDNKLEHMENVIEFRNPVCGRDTAWQPW